MPELVHLLIREPAKGRLAQALQSLKQSVARRLALRAAESFWQARCYDFNVCSERKFTEKLRYIHRHPVTGGLVDRPEGWRSSSFRHYLTGETCGVEIESQWAARARERLEFFRACRLAPLRLGVMLEVG
jgi:putative transposase